MSDKPSWSLLAPHGSTRTGRLHGTGLGRLVVVAGFGDAVVDGGRWVPEAEG